jgi:hypothetical protein
MADDNKPLKYMRYAIGEIVLVVIGILIALQVNNWNEQRKFNSLKNVYVKKLIEDLKQDTAQIASKLDILVKAQQNIKDAIDKIDTETNQQLLITSIEDYFNGGWNMIEFTPSIITFSDLSQTGNLNVFKNPDLTGSIQQYYVSLESFEKSHTLNKDWITPIDVALAQNTSAFEFDNNTKELFQENKQLEALENILNNKNLFKRNAAGHFWFNKVLIKTIAGIKVSAIELISTLQLELEKDK